MILYFDRSELSTVRRLALKSNAANDWSVEVSESIVCASWRENGSLAISLMKLPLLKARAVASEFAATRLDEGVSTEEFGLRACEVARCTRASALLKTGSATTATANCAGGRFVS